MKNLLMKNQGHRLAGLLMVSAVLCFQVVHGVAGTVQGELNAKPLGQTLAVGALVEALDATDATVVQTAVVNDDDTFVLTLPAGDYRICFRFASSPNAYQNARSFYNEEDQSEKPPILCFGESTIVSVGEDSTTTIEPFVGYQSDPMLVVTCATTITGTITDPEGLPLDGIQVDLLAACTANVIRTVETGKGGKESAGQFSISGELPYCPWKIRFSDPSGKYATSFHGADDFIGATAVGDADILKTLEPKPMDIEVSPLTHEFGDVALTESATAIVTLTSQGNADLHVTALTLADTDTTYITVKSAPAMPLVLSPGETSEVVLGFRPLTLGAATANLVITSNDPDEATVVVTLNGTGVASSAPPAEQVAVVLAFMEESVSDGTLQGTGPAGADSAHVRALMEQIKAASDLAQSGKTQAACKQLENAQQRTDGDPKPPDFVSGPAAEVLWLLVELTRLALGCP